MLEFLLFGLVAGFLVKAVDTLVDEQGRGRSTLALAGGMLYGFFLGTIAVFDPRLATIIVAVVLANLLAGKFDSHAHMLALVVMALVALFAGVEFAQGYGLILAIAFACAAFADEALNKAYESRRMAKTKNKILLLMRRYEPRPFLEAAALLASAVLWDWVYFAFIISFDLAYLLSNKLIANSMNRN